MKNIIWVLTCFLILTIVSGCATSPINSTPIPTCFNHPICSRVDSFVIESRGILGLPILMNYPLEIVASFPCQSWREYGVVNRRVIGMIPKGTPIYLVNYRVPSLLEKNYDCDTHISIRIGCGTFANQCFEINTCLLKNLLGIQPFYRRATPCLESYFS